MASLILKKIRNAFLPPEEASLDRQCLHHFYRASDDLVQQHFNAELTDDLRTVFGTDGGPEEDWAW